MAAKNLTTDDLESGDTLTDTESGETLEYSHTSRVSGDAKFDRLDDDGDLLGWREESPESVDERLANGRYEGETCAIYQPTVEDTDLDINAETDVYLRFGDVPEGERSTNHIDGSKEDGVSVFAATDEPAGEETENPVMFVPVGSKVQQVLLLATRDSYLVTGEEVGTGTDGEPVLRGVETICEVRTPKGVGGFVPVGEN